MLVHYGSTEATELLKFTSGETEDGGHWTTPKLDTFKLQQLSDGLLDFSAIWFVGAIWVCEAGLMIKAKNDWQDGQYQVAMQH